MTQCATPPGYDLDKVYYWDFITFSVENRLFRVPKYRLISDSEYFASKYALDTAIGDSGGSENEYATIEKPQLDAVKLDDASADEFQSFLKAVYPMVIQGELTLSKDEWLSVLKLSTRWFFNDLRKMAIEKLTVLLNLSPVEKIQLGKEYSIEGWLLAGYRELVMRYEPITVEEAQMIGLKQAIQLNPIRERWIRQDYPTIPQHVVSPPRTPALAQSFSPQPRTPALSPSFNPPLHEPSPCVPSIVSPSPRMPSLFGPSIANPSPRIPPPDAFINQLVHATFDEDFKLVQSTQSQYRTAEEKEEEKRLAEYVKEAERLRDLEDQEEKKLTDLMLELEQQRKKLGELKPVGDCRSMTSTPANGYPTSISCGFPKAAPPVKTPSGWGGWGVSLSAASDAWGCPPPPPEPKDDGKPVGCPDPAVGFRKKGKKVKASGCT